MGVSFGAGVACVFVFAFTLSRQRAIHDRASAALSAASVLSVDVETLSGVCAITASVDELDRASRNPPSAVDTHKTGIIACMASAEEATPRSASR